MSQNPPPPPSQDPYGAQPGQPAYGQQGQPQQPGGAYPPQGYAQPGKPLGAGLAITALIFGILALLFCWTVIGGILFGLIALIVGFIASGKAKRGTARGRGMAITGIVLGIVGALLSIVIIAIGASFLNSDSGKNLQDCLKSASSQADRDKCSQDFSNDLSN